MALIIGIDRVCIYGLKVLVPLVGDTWPTVWMHIGYMVCKANPDLWYKLMIGPEDRYEYYAYIQLYDMDNCLAVHRDAENVPHEFDKFYVDDIGDADTYLGVKLKTSGTQQ